MKDLMFGPLTFPEVYDTVDGVFDKIFKLEHSHTQEFHYRTNEKDNILTYEYDMPGFKINDINIELHNEKMVKMDAQRGERDFHLNFTVPNAYDPESIKCTLEDGILIMTFSKKESFKSRKIAINQKV